MDDDTDDQLVEPRQGPTPIWQRARNPREIAEMVEAEQRRTVVWGRTS